MRLVFQSQDLFIEPEFTLKRVAHVRFLTESMPLAFIELKLDNSTTIFDALVDCLCLTLGNYHVDLTLQKLENRTRSMTGKSAIIPIV